MFATVRKALFSLCLLMLAGTLPAFNLSGARWEGGTARFYTGISGSSPSGTAWSAALQQAMEEWSSRTDFEFIMDPAFRDPCAGYSRDQNDPGGFPDGNGDTFNGVGFHPDVCGNNLGDEVLAITLRLQFPGSFGFSNFKEADIVFNSSFNWDVFTGPTRFNSSDFRRVALHELGHAIGLDHENMQQAIMGPQISSLDALTADDIAGANQLYGIPEEQCLFTTISKQHVIQGSLAEGDCRIQDLFGGGSDTSFVDAYSLSLAEATTLNLAMHATQLDAVIVITNPQLVIHTIIDDGISSCSVSGQVTLPAGNWLVLANTFDVPQLCPTNTGNYTLSITDSALPLMGATANLNSAGDIPAALFSGGATADEGLSFPAIFTASAGIDVWAEILVDPAHAGEAGNIYVLAILDDGSQYMQIAGGEFVPFTGPLSTLLPAQSGVLAARESFSIIENLQGIASGLAGRAITVYVGYALVAAPQDLYYATQPLVFAISQN